MAAQGIKKLFLYKKQSAKNVPATGSGGQLLRRRTGMFTKSRDTYANDELVSHRQSTGATAGISRIAGRFSGLLSPLTYQDIFAQALMKGWVATTAITGLTVTIAASGTNWTVTRSTGDWLAGFAKIGDVFRLSGGTLDASNINKNLVIVGATATILTVRVVNGSALVAQSAIATVTATFPGKKVWVPTTGHTDDWLTWEEVYPDLDGSVTSAEQNIDTKIGTATIGIPATGNVTIDLEMMSLSRTRGSSATLTTPTTETTTPVASSASGCVIVNGIAQPITGATITIATGYQAGEAEVGANTLSDMAAGRLQVSGSFTAKFGGTTLQQIFDDQTVTALVFVCPVDGTANSDFVSFSIPRVKLFGDAPDDGEKEIIRTYPFTAEINSAGGASLASYQTILSIHDSLATAT